MNQCLTPFEYSLRCEAAVCKCAEGGHGVDLCLNVCGREQWGECVELLCVAEITPDPYQLHQGGLRTQWA